MPAAPPRRHVRPARSRHYHAACWIPAGLAAALGAAQLPAITHVSNLIFDAYQRAAPRLWDPSGPVRVVDIDDESIARLGQWPWPRTRVAALVDRLREANAAAIGFDIVFAETDRTDAQSVAEAMPDGRRKDALKAALKDSPDNDRVLAEAIAKAPVVLGLILTQRTTGTPSLPRPYGMARLGDDPAAFVAGFPGAVTPLSGLGDRAAGAGFLNWLADGDQIVRQVPLLLRSGDRLVPSLAMEAVRVAQGASTYLVRASNASGEFAFGAKSGISAIRVGNVDALTSADGSVRVRFSPHEEGRFLPAWRVLAGLVDRGEIDGRVLLIGSSSAGLTDVRATPVDAAMPGIEIQAQTLENLVTQSQLLRPDWAPALELALCLVAAVALWALMPIVPVVASGILLLIGIAVVILVSGLAFLQSHILLDPLAPGVTLLAVYLGGTASLFRSEQRNRRFVQDAFGRFVSPDVVARLAADPSQLVLGGEQRPLTVMFTDVRDFSVLAERMSASALARFMNAYLSPMSEIVLEHQGTVDKYIGDAIMAFWNAPLPTADHAEAGARAALAMIAALPAINATLETTAGHMPVPVRCGIGLATGPCVVGNLGSALRFDYSALGDHVNLASRLEGLTKVYRLDILAAEETQLQSAGLAWLEIDAVVVKGRSATTRIFTLLGDEVVARSDAFRAVAALQAGMLACLRDQRIEEAAGILERLTAIAPPALAGFYAAQAERFAALPIESSDAADVSSSGRLREDDRAVA